MSHFVECQTQIRDLPALRLALQDMGWPTEEIAIHATPVPLYGYHDDARPELAHLVIHRQYVGGCSNDIGFVRRADGTYAAIISEFDQRNPGHHGPYDQAWLGRLTQAYAARVVTAQYLKKGWQVHRDLRQDGSIRLTARRA